MDWEQILEEAGLKPYELDVSADGKMVLAYYRSKARAEQAEALFKSKGGRNYETFQSVDREGLWVAGADF
jgi:hypothetical protein